MNQMSITAASYLHSGLSVIPTCTDKRPGCPWKVFTERRPTDREVEANFRNAAGIGIVCGRVSGNLELLDFDDGGSRFEPWFCAIPRYLCSRLVIESTPSGGRHVYYRVTDGYSVPGNRKLAMKPDGHVLIETRGEGGYVKCAPSTGYELMQGNFLNIPTISPFEENILIEEAKKLDEKVKAEGEGEGGGEGEGRGRVGGSAAPRIVSPLDVLAMEQALTGAGWTKVKDGPEQHWERPGKNERSTSATFNGEVFYVFSSNAAPFEPNRGYGVRSVVRLLTGGKGGGDTPHPEIVGALAEPSDSSELNKDAPVDPGPLPDALLHMPGFVDLLTEHTLATAPYPNRPLAFAGALAMLSHLTGRNFRDPRNLRTNIYLLALADSGVGKDYPRKVNMNLAGQLGIMPTMADRFASAEGLEDALLVHPASFFQVDEVDTLFAALQEKKDSAMEKVYGALLQFATSSDTIYAMRKKAIQQTGGKACQFDKVRARGIVEPHLTLLGCAIPKYLYGALSERALENGLISRCLILEAGERGRSGNPHAAPFSEALLRAGRSLVAHGGFAGLDLANLEDAPPPYVEPFTVSETAEAEAAHDEVVSACEKLYDAAKTTSERALWTRGAEKAARLALLHAISENPDEPLITEPAVRWGWAIVEHLTKRMLYQASVYVHDNEFDALRQKALRQIRNQGGEISHGHLLRNLHIDSDTMRRVIDTLIQSELITVQPLQRGGLKYVMA